MSNVWLKQQAKEVCRSVLGLKVMIPIKSKKWSITVNVKKKNCLLVAFPL